MAAKAKEIRDESETDLITAIEELNIAAAISPVNKRVIDVNIRNVESCFDRLKKVHSQYCQKAKIGLGSSDSTEFL